MLREHLTCSFHSRRPLPSWCGQGQCLLLDAVCWGGSHRVHTSWGASAVPARQKPPELNWSKRYNDTTTWGVLKNQVKSWWNIWVIVFTSRKRPALSHCMSVETHKSEGKSGCRGLGLTFEDFKLPLLLSVLIDCCREERAARQLLANGSIFCETGNHELMTTLESHTSQKIYRIFAQSVTLTCLKWIQWLWS